MKCTFSTTLWKWPSAVMPWYFVSVPKEYYSAIREKYGKGLKRVKITVGKSTWETSLLPHSASGTYLVALKASIRKAEGLFEGDNLTAFVELL